MILVTGGTGLVGSKVVQLLQANQQPVRVFARGLHDWKDASEGKFRREGVEVVTGDVRNQTRLIKAVEGCKAIINLASVMRGDADYTLTSVNSESVLNLVAVAQEAGVQRLIHVSCLGATQHSGCQYFSSKWQAEIVVKSSTCYWTIFRPSMIFGEGCSLVDVLNFWVKLSPWVPVIGSGLNLIQPISADDVAACIVQSIYNKDTVNQTYDLVGPKAYSLTELLQIMSDRSARPKPLIKIPGKFGFKLAYLLGKLNKKSPIDEDVMKIMTTDLISDPALMKSIFKVQGESFDSAVPRLTARL